MDTSTTYNTANTLPQDTLAPVLQSAHLIAIDAVTKSSINTGNRWCKLIKKGENSKLQASVAVEIPHRAQMQFTGVPAVDAYLMEAYYQLENEAVKAQVIAGKRVIEYSCLNTANLAEIATALQSTSGIGQLSEEAIKTWYNASALDYVLVAIADRLGVSEQATQAELTKCNQVSNQILGNMVKLASRKPVTFDDKVKKALNMALDAVLAVDSANSMATRLHSKLNATVTEQDMLDALGF